MKYGYVNTNLLDLWNRPQFNSERISQLFFNEPVVIVSERKGFLHIQQIDKYSGWVDKRFVTTVAKKGIENHFKHINSIITVSSAILYDSDGNKTVPPFFLYYGTRLFARGEKNGYIQAVLPDNRTVFLKSFNIKPINKKMGINIKGTHLTKETVKFLGVPYLWGGISPAGFDCSGLIRTVCSRFGINLPRDTRDQVKAGKRINRDRVKTGDLLFFNRHVGFAVGPDRIIHSSVGGGGVRINSLRADMPDYREDLDHNYNQARRII